MDRGRRSPRHPRRATPEPTAACADRSSRSPRTPSRQPPAGPAIWIDAPLEQPLDPYIVVPVGLAEQDRAETVRVELATLHQDFQCSIVVGLGCVIGNLLVVRIRAPLEQQ